METIKQISELPKDKVGMILFIIVVVLFGAYKVYMAINGKKLEKEKEIEQNNEDSSSMGQSNTTSETQHQQDSTTLRDRIRANKPPQS
ncbi:hypothetical protein MASR1M48_16400 [Lactococcus petauri]